VQARLDLDLQQRVLAELEWEPGVDATQIRVAVDRGAVTLAGTVASYAEKLDAERAVRRLAGIRALVSNLEVRPQLALVRTDTGVGRAVTQALEWNVAVPHERIRARVKDGEVTLEGQVPFQFQRAAAESAVTHLPGVKGVHNLITIRAGVSASDVKSRIEAALRRSAEIDARSVQVEIQGGTVTLRGQVRSWAERKEAERAAWAAPGVCEVRDELEVA
jgi:osmotically-inducible protein OsmY